jgi:hypothetical protein
MGFFLLNLNLIALLLGGIQWFVFEMSPQRLMCGRLGAQCSEVQRYGFGEVIGS